MVLYIQDNNPRIQYISAFIGDQITGSIFEITTDQEYFKSFDGPKINYSNNKLCENEFWLLPYSLLFETGTREHSIESFSFENTIAIFKTGGDIPFDIFAASFYLLSRYEEYLPHAKDIYERYAHENSIAFREGFLHLPVVDQWIVIFTEKLISKFPSLTVKLRRFTFIPTYDIDEAYSYQYKNFARNFAGAMKAIFRGKWNLVSERWNVLKGRIPDPFDSYFWIDQINERYNLDPIYFFLVAARNGKYDRHILPSHNAIRKLIQQHSRRYETAVHPSWQSGHENSLLATEISTIEGMTGKKVVASRQHYIHFSLPETYRLLAENGIDREYSMGYGSINGFRASVATPFDWYDLENEQVTKLKIFPFCFMEANSFFEQEMSTDEALKELIQYYEVVKSVNGTLITVWHNTFLGTSELFKGWRESYEAFLAYVSNK